MAAYLDMHVKFTVAVHVQSFTSQLLLQGGIDFQQKFDLGHCTDCRLLVCAQLA